MGDIKRFSVSLKGVPKDELEVALRVLTRSFEVLAVAVREHDPEIYDIPIELVRKQARKGDGAEGGVL